MLSRLASVAVRNGLQRQAGVLAMSQRAMSSNIGHVIGIDLGTTVPCHSCSKSAAVSVRTTIILRSCQPEGNLDSQLRAEMVRALTAAKRRSSHAIVWP